MNPDGVIRRAAARRAQAHRRAESELSRIAGVLLDNEDLDVADVAADTGIRRALLLDRMDEVKRLREYAGREGLELVLPSLDSPQAPDPAPADSDR